jgi:hypothetical protein
MVTHLDPTHTSTSVTTVVSSELKLEGNLGRVELGPYMPILSGSCRPLVSKTDEPCKG